ncbi:MAG: recombinase family protein, partial [Chloroflexi bacterium]|nr:recombinase family protein [Chloroflexota bacterium]
NFRERSTLGKRGTAKQGRVPTGRLPYGYQVGQDGRAEVIEEQAEVVRRIFQMYVHEGMGSYSIAIRLTDEGIPTQRGKLIWLQSRVHHILGNAAYTGSWLYGKYRHVSTEDGMKIHEQPQDNWIEIPIPQIIDDETWERAQALKKQRSRNAKRNTKVLYLLQHLLRCGECGHNFHARAAWTSVSVRNGKRYTYELTSPRRYYQCNGMQSMRLDCRERPHIRAERLEEPVWNEVKRVIQNPGLIVAGIDTLDSMDDGGLEEEIGQAERDLRSVQMEEDRAIRLFVSGKITEAQLDHQRRFITERLETARAKLDDCRARAASGTEKRELMEAVLSWAKEVGQGLDELTPEQCQEILQMVVEQVVIDRENNVDITLAIPIGGDDNSSEPGPPQPESPETNSVAIGSRESSFSSSTGSSPTGIFSASTCRKTTSPACRRCATFSP